MALSALWVQLSMCHSQPPNMFVTHPECLLPQEFCLGNTLPILLAPSVQGFASHCKCLSRKFAFPQKNLVKWFQSSFFFSHVIIVYNVFCVEKYLPVLRTGLSFLLQHLKFSTQISLLYLVPNSLVFCLPCPMHQTPFPPCHYTSRSTSPPVTLTSPCKPLLSVHGTSPLLPPSHPTTLNGPLDSPSAVSPGQLDHQTKMQI
jgi:hypothetical protein